MTIELITGLPGSGKSLSAVERIVDESRKAIPRAVYVCGLEGLKDGLALPLEDPLGWESLPDGSLIVVDEAQRFFPARRSGNPIPPVTALSMHRHRGFDFVLITQNPTMLDSYVRKLVGKHVHISRRFGSAMVAKFEWSECVEDTQSTGMRSKAVKTLWRYPKPLFALYHSATIHTGKRKIPTALKLGAVFALLVAAAGWWKYDHLFGAKAKVESPVSVSADAAKGKPGAEQGKVSALSSRPHEKRWKDAGEYAADHIPRVGSLPWSAPIFDDRKVIADPQVFCVIVEGKPCKCYTEQITPYEMEAPHCEHIARHGVYNPYKATFASRNGEVQSVPAVKPDASSDGAGSAGRPDIPQEGTLRSVISENAVRPGVPAGGPQWVHGQPQVH